MKLSKNDRCTKKDCRNEWEIIYLGDKICQRCFDKICEEQDKKSMEV